MTTSALKALAGAVLFSTISVASNSVTITNLETTGQGLRPFTISRLFKQGDISSYAQPSVGGAPLTTWQCDVKSRWPGGSLKHALISFRYTIPASSSITVLFVDNVNPSSAGDQTSTNAAALDGAGMLAFDTGGGASSWGGVISATASSITNAADARTMLAAGKFSYWLRGPVVTQAIVEDRTPALAYDFGWTCSANCTGDYSTATWTQDATYKSLHPIFVTTFYPGYPGVKVEYILENLWSTKFQDQRYTVTLYKDNPSTTQAMAATTYPQWAGTRWHKTFWSGSTPGVVKIDYNLAYMVSTKALPNYDLTKVVSSAGINQTLSQWATSDKGAMFGNWVSGSGNQNGFWLKYQPTAGESTNWGVFTTWQTRYLYTFHTTADGNDLYNVMLANADAAGAMPYHYREGSSSGPAFCSLSQTCVTDGLNAQPSFGRVESRDANPLGIKPNPGATSPTIRAALSSAGLWTIDLAHQPSIAYLPYLITGDWYWLDEINFLSSWTILQLTPGTTLVHQSHNDWAYIAGEIRGDAWALLHLAQAAFINPDNTPEKDYFAQKMLNNIAIHEGKLNVTDGYGYTGDNIKWQWGYTRGSALQGDTEQTTHIANPLNFVNFNAYDPAMEGCDPTKTLYAESPWMIHYFDIMLGIAEEMGFPITKLKETLYRNEIQQLQDPAYNPWLNGNYRMPVISKATGTWFTTWALVRDAYDSSNQNRTTWWSGTTDPSGGYPFEARAAASFYDGTDDPALSCTPNCGTIARQWLDANVPNQNLENDNPKWAFIPRLSACDANGDGVVDIRDVLMEISQALGITPCTTDPDVDGVCNIVDLLRVTQAALGQGCIVGK